MSTRAPFWATSTRRLDLAAKFRRLPLEHAARAPTKQTERKLRRASDESKVYQIPLDGNLAVYRALSLSLSSGVFADLPNSLVWEAESDTPLGGLLSDPM